jgi:hypothetical protein
VLVQVKGKQMQYRRKGVEPLAAQHQVGFCTGMRGEGEVPVVQQ